MLSNSVLTDQVIKCKKEHLSSHVIKCGGQQVAGIFFFLKPLILLKKYDMFIA